MIIKQAAERVVLVGPGPGLLDAAVTAGLDVWVVSDTGSGPPHPQPPAGLPAHQLLRVDFADPLALRDVLARAVAEHGIGHVLYLASDLERGLGSGAAAAEDLLRELSPAVGQPTGRLPDAVAIRRILNQSRTSAVRAEEARSIAEARTLAEDFPLPVVIKSADKAGCWWTVPVHDRSGLDQWAERAVTARHSAPYLVEELLTGAKFQVETLTVDGMHLVAGITPEGNAAPLPDGEQAGVRATVRALLDLAGYERGTTRTDVLVGARGSRIAAATEPDRERTGNGRSRPAVTSGIERGTDR
ncbi:hypothetical protein AW27_016580 [Streptomyces sp. PCS3-D2]|uniref:hypothetical protein n=1 Tax=Streptomyces sp. PCS3-D2 TaxID=1460244 RepID=UPI00044791AE|nr:hypothetical protein [Streptomyces sp. PCS3-D2]WKV73011.1 hypothetical protein AW27_016580 [Streptomyces sp. PCS3-D2]